MLNDLLIPVAQSIDPVAGTQAQLPRLIGLGIFWTAIILPEAGLSTTAEKRHASIPRRAFEAMRFMSFAVAVAYLGDLL